MKQFIHKWPIGCFVAFVLVHLFAFEPVAAFSPHLAFGLRIVTVCLAWAYLVPNWSASLNLSFAKFPVLVVSALFLYSMLFFPGSPFSFSLDVKKAGLHVLISTWEELLMRGLFLGLLLSVYPRRPLFVLILSGSLFGLLHFLNLLNGAEFAETLSQVAWSCALGIAFATITYVSQSVVPAIVMHCWFNMIPALWDGKPWIVAQTAPYGLAGSFLVAAIYLPLILISIGNLRRSGRSLA